MKKGDCIIVACQNVLDNNWIFCYAYVQGQGKLKGQKILHAWNEVNNFVLDFSNGEKVVTEKRRYYKIAKIKEKDITRQTTEEVRELMLKTETYGGWIK